MEFPGATFSDGKRTAAREKRVEADPPIMNSKISYTPRFYARI
jgi:hypothetical protein